MASNSFGNIFRITTWGESHGKAIGVVIDGCPSGLELNDEVINKELALRAPGRNPYTSPRKEQDRGEILSGTFEGKTTGCPISIIIWNKDADSSKYNAIKSLLRPGHANYTYLQKYGIFDHNGGGRSSARETACRVAAGAVAKQLLLRCNIQALSYISEVDGIKSSIEASNAKSFENAIKQSPIFCPDPKTSALIIRQIEKAKLEQDSLGGVIEFAVFSLPPGLGDPIYHKLEALLASALMSIPAAKGFEIGSGFQSAKMHGSKHNDSFLMKNEKVETKTNHSGGILGGISSGMPVTGRVAFKPTSSIAQPQKTIDLKGRNEIFSLPKGSRHDPCLALRAVPIVDAMLALVIADTLLMNRSAKL